MCASEGRLLSTMEKRQLKIPEKSDKPYLKGLPEDIVLKCIANSKLLYDLQ